jgi:phosphoribosylformylglycinamidine (FGAM) synthase-like enzyme
MFARIEVALKPDYQDHLSAPLLRRMEMTDPHLRKLVRWARSMTVYWLDVPLSREELIYASQETLWDPVLHYLFTGNLIPSAAGKHGNVEDILETAPNRPGKFFVLEKRFRIGVTDHASKTLIDSFEAILKKKLGPETRVCSGSMLLLEGPQLTEDDLARIAREYFSNELLESWTLLNEKEVAHTERFHPERVRREMPKLLQGRLAGRLGVSVERVPLSGLTNSEARNFCKRKGFTFTDAEFNAIRERMATAGENATERDITDVELEFLAKAWREVPFRRLLRAEILPDDGAREVDDSIGRPLPEKISGLVDGTFKRTIDEVPRAWIVSAFENGPTLLQYDDEDFLSLEGEIESKTVACDSNHGALMGYSEIYLRSICAGRGARPILATDVVFASDHVSSSSSSDRASRLHPRRILDGVKQGISKAGSQLGVPTIGGALYLDPSEGLNPLIHFSSISLMPRLSSEIPAETREVFEGDRLVILGSPTGKDGMPGVPPVQICDTLLLRSLGELATEIRDLGWNRLFVPCGEGGIAAAAWKIAREFGGAEVDLNQVPLKFPSLRPMEIIGSETAERIIAIIPEERVDAVIGLAKRRGVLGADIGSVVKSGTVAVRFDGESVVDFDVKFVRGNQPRSQEPITRSESALQTARRVGDWGDPAKEGVEVLLRILGHPNVCSREWLIRQLDHEVQGMSALKPIHTVSVSPDVHHSGPNDGGAVKVKTHSNLALVMTTGLTPRLRAWDPYLMGAASVDEAVRNALACGADYGKEEFLFALTYQFSCPGQDLENPALRGDLVRACVGASHAAVELQAPFVHGQQKTIMGQSSKLHFFVQALSRATKTAGLRSADFKTPGDAIYLLGPSRFALAGSLVSEIYGPLPGDAGTPVPEWDTARRLYSWLGGGIGKEQKKLRSIHDVSDGGMMAAIAESCLARGLGASLQYPEGLSRTGEWEFLFGEGFHSFVASCSENDAAVVEADLQLHEIPYVRLGTVNANGVVQVRRGDEPVIVIETKVLRQAWKKEGYWE